MKLKHPLKRVLFATLIGMVLGVLCILGQAQRGPENPLPNATIYLLHAWYNRVLMGMMIGFAGDWILVKQKPLMNAVNSASSVPLLSLFICTSSFMEHEMQLHAESHLIYWESS